MIGFPAKASGTMKMSNSNGNSKSFVGAVKLKSGDEIRLEVTNYTGEYRVNIRRWFLTDSGEHKPTKDGFTFPVSHLLEFLRLVRKAREWAKSMDQLLKKMVA
jgi:hypothetical protein